MIVYNEFLTLNQFSRPGRKRAETLGIVMHYLGVDGQTASQCRAYFEGLKIQNPADNIEDRSASAHDIVDLDGTILAVVPDDEKAYHAGAAHYTDLAKERLGKYATDPNTSPNSCLIGIEMCHLAGGRIPGVVFGAAAERAAYYCIKYNLDPWAQIWRHHDITGKNCPSQWVASPELFAAFRELVKAKIKSLKETNL